MTMRCAMKSMRSLFVLACALAPLAAAADDLAPGQWQITLESRVPGDAGWAPAPVSMTQCLTAADAHDPSRLIGSVSTPGATGCNYTEKSYAGNTFRFALECPGTFALKTRGSVNFSANRFEGNITANSNLGGNTVVMQNRVSGRRLGSC